MLEPSFALFTTDTYIGFTKAKEDQRTSANENYSV